MGRLTGKNLLIIIPIDYYNEEELNIPLEIFKKEGARVVIASPKMKEAVGEKNGRVMPNVLVVDAIEDVSSNFEKSSLLTALGPKLPNDAEVIDSFRSVAKTITSDFEYGKVMRSVDF